MSDDNKAGGIVGAIVGIASTLIGGLSGSASDRADSAANDWHDSQREERVVQSERESSTERTTSNGNQVEDRRR